MKAGLYSQHVPLLKSANGSLKRSHRSIDKSEAEAKRATTTAQDISYFLPHLPCGVSVPYFKHSQVVLAVAHIAAKEGVRGSSGNLIDMARQWVEKQGLLPSNEEISLTESFLVVEVLLQYFYMAGSSSYKLDPGSLEPSVLTQQLTHRSRDIWDRSADMILNTRKSDGSFWKLVEKYPIHPRVLEVIKLSGLYSVYRCNRPAIDRSLITSLVERWRPETHTFHFRTGEATITLQDIEVLYGLPVNGALVLGIEMTRTIGDWQNICQRLLGFVPSLRDFTSSFLKVSALKVHMLSEPQLSDMATQEIVNQKARCYIVPIFYWDVVEVHLPDRVMRQFGLQQARHIHSMVDKAKSLGDTPSYEDLHMFRKMVLDQSFDCLRYVYEDDRIHISADYRRDEVQPDQLHPPIRRRGKDGVAGRRERAIARDQVPVEMNEMDEVMQNAQISSKDDQATTNHDFGSTSMGYTQEFTQASGMIYQHTEIVPYMTPETPQTPQISRYPSLSSLDNIFGSYQPQHFENTPNFTSSPVQMSIDIPDATNNLENLNTEMEDNELDDSNNEVNDVGLTRGLRAGTVWINCYDVFDTTIPTTSCMFFEFKVPLIPPYVVRRINPICVVAGWVGLIIALELRGFVGLWLLIWVALSIGLSVPQSRPGVLTWIALAFCILLLAVRAYLESRAVVAAEVATAEGQELPDVARHPLEP
ncbi:hypothetical protein FXO37_16303 [Capsicum annuum]|nr:hypothetical protein FXO37_16303 [Capsicum annuum]